MKPTARKTLASTIMQQPLTMSTSVMVGEPAAFNGTSLRWKKPFRPGSANMQPSVRTWSGSSMKHMTGPKIPNSGAPRAAGRSEPGKGGEKFVCLFSRTSGSAPCSKEYRIPVLWPPAQPPLEQGAGHVVLLNNDTTVSPPLLDALLQAARGAPEFGIL